MNDGSNANAIPKIPKIGQLFYDFSMADPSSIPEPRPKPIPAFQLEGKKKAWATKPEWSCGEASLQGQRSAMEDEHCVVLILIPNN